MKTWLISLGVCIIIFVSYLVGHINSSYDAADRFEEERVRISALQSRESNPKKIAEVMKLMKSWGYSHFDDYKIPGGCSVYVFSRESYGVPLQSDYFEVFIVFDAEGILLISRLGVEQTFSAL